MAKKRENGSTTDLAQGKRGAVTVRRRYPIGAEPQPDGGTHFRVWAPTSETAGVEIEQASYPLTPEPGGYFSGLVEAAEPGMLYKIRLSNGAFPDPASRFQPQGPHGPSQIIETHSFQWTDRHWKGMPRRGQVIYELHIGTFTAEGTWAAAGQQLPELAELGITAIEVMPVADFPGEFGWGYDGVNMFAPTRLYGTPDDLRQFIDQAHRLGLAVLLDVVYNHFGPDGNYIREFSPDYFSRKYKNEWGDPINFDDRNCGPVREFFITNARYWIDEFHFDGLRLDATQQIFDATSPHIVQEVTSAARQAAPERAVYVVAENEAQESKLARACERGGHGLDSVWNDDFHHSALVALTGRNEAYYTDYSGKAQELLSACKWGYLYQGQWYKWQRKTRGAPALDLDPEQFVTFIENHDQVANSLRGVRLHQLTSPGRFRAATALLLLAPGTPMLFQGQEFAASSPFVFFADHNPELNALVARGRLEFLQQFGSIGSSDCDKVVARPGDKGTFQRCKLDLSERQKNAPIYRLHKDLLRMRSELDPIREARRGSYDGAVLGEEAFLLRFFGEHSEDLLLLVNFGRDLHLNPAPEPLLAPPVDRDWHLHWSSEHPDYGGCGTREFEDTDNWHIHGHAAILLKPGARKERADAKTGS
jgi:maltooligosyltrehalose trehalohydrolase